MEPSDSAQIPGLMTALVRVVVLLGILLVELLVYVRRREPGRARWPRAIDLMLICAGVAVVISFLWF